MSNVVNVHEASQAERLAAYRNVHESWGGTLPMDTFVSHRLNSPMHNRARWFVATCDESVVSSLAWYPLTFCHRARLVSGIGIGAVHTVPAYRRRGFAAQLLAEVINRARHEGISVGLLFSDIDPAYYERFGFVRWPAEAHRCDLTQVPVTAETFQLERIEPLRQVDQLADLYQATNASAPLRLHRDVHYWDVCIRRFPLAEYYALKRQHSAPMIGYARVHWTDCSMQLEDYAVSHPDLEPALLQHLIAQAQRRGMTEIEGWLPSSRAVLRYFDSAPRTGALTMLAALDGAVELNPSRASHFWMSDHF